MTELVQIAVPVDRVREVYELLAREPAGSADAHHDSEDGYPAGWSKALIDRMFVESSRAMRGILTAIARKSPGWVTTDEIAEASGLTTRQVVASLGPFKKRVRGRYGMKHWPFASREFGDVGILKYSMSPITADRILELNLQFDQHEEGGR
ncbi:MAG: hypothetical protein ACNA76_06130 [Anaerosomatales bacterium]